MLCVPAAAKHSSPPLRCDCVSGRRHDTLSSFPSFRGRQEWVDVKVTMLFVIFDVCAFIHRP